MAFDTGGGPFPGEQPEPLHTLLRDDPDPLAGLGPRGRRRRTATRRQRRGSRLRLALVILLLTPVLALAAAAAATAVWIDRVTAGVSITTMPEHVPGVNSVIRDDRGRLLARVASTQNRIPVPGNRISSWLKEATVAIEDRRFYQHGGLDYEAMARALWADLGAGHVIQGGSTIEQQLAKLLFLDDSQTLTRKVQEATLATQLADHWSRARILDTYLVVVPYGGVEYGCEAAAQAYFDTSCARMTLRQAATLAGLPQSPTEYDPQAHPAAALERRNQVLTAMADSGDITQRLAASVERRPLGLHRFTPDPVRQPYFVQYVEQQLRARYGRARLETGGLDVSTTIDERLQTAAIRAFHAVLHTPGDPAAALVAMDPRTGAVLAFDASTNPRRVHYDLPSQAHRQAGSAFKPFALLAAMIDDHIDPETTYYSSAAPFETVVPGCDPAQPSCHWKVNNAEPGGSGDLNLHEALDGSVNAVFARLSMDIGAAPTVAIAYRLGIPRSDHLPVVPSIVLGTGLVSPLDMTSAYATIANGGVLFRPPGDHLDSHAQRACPPSHTAGPQSRAAGDPGVGRVGADLDPEGQHHVPARAVHGRWRPALASASPGRQDRNRRGAPRRMVLRLYAGHRSVRLDGVSLGRAQHDRGCGRCAIVRRRLPRHDLAGRHDAGGRGAAGPLPSAPVRPHPGSGRVVQAMGLTRDELTGH